MKTGLELTSFDDFLKLARRQAEPQQLLFVFTRNELPADHTPEQAASYAAGQGGHLAPVVCVDRGLHEIAGFEAFASEAEAHIDDWAVIFAAALPGIGNRPPTPLAIDQALERMVETVRGGQIASYIAFDREGIPLRLATSH
ncbi:hypothetical protein [Thiocystis violacea]|uniref:hypothetical protein n=1 Tax=Thiocystis violacea TaxID=13725 RepID=UPI001908FF96|nr:hypothetical protein [Thiocystis violacea]